jgi:hypothetical protein
VGANDEDNVLRLYSTAGGPPVNDNLLTLDSYLEVDGPEDEKEVDLESAAELDGLIYWIGSHSQSKKGKDRPNRWRLFATKSGQGADGKPTLETFGKPCKTLREVLVADPQFTKFALATAITIAPKLEGGFNIESICAERGGKRLLIGLRNPISLEGALLVPLKNPRDVVESGAAPVFDKPELVDLDGLGFRDMVIAGDGYLILAGDYKDRNAEGARPSKLFAWEGPGSKARAIDADLGDLNPEALVVLPGQKIMIVSDDGTRLSASGKTCKESLVEERRFRAAFLQGWWPFSKTA